MRDRHGAAAVFMCAMLPGAIAVGAINRYLYESAFNSGYGSFSTIYAPEHFWPNLLNYVVAANDTDAIHAPRCGGAAALPSS